jgi:hypothetical protein
MTRFQLICAAVFLLGVVAVYRTQLLSCVRGLFKAQSDVPKVQSSIAVSLVDDILSVTQLRDRLAAEGCEEGVEACTVLLRVIVEYQQPSKGVV